MQSLAVGIRAEDGWVSQVRGLIGLSRGLGEGREDVWLR